MVRIELARGMGARMSAALAALFAAAAASCASVSSPETFQTFAESSREVREGADESIAKVHGWSHKRYVASAAASEPNAIGALLLEADDKDPFSWQMAEPSLPLKVLRFRGAVLKFNDSLVGYAEALHRLASGELASVEDFDALAAELNANARAAIEALELSESVSDREVGLFSAGALGLFRAYIENRRASALAGALADNQDAILAFAGSGQEAIQLIVRALWNEYDARSGELARLLASDPDGSQADRAKLVESLLALNEEYVQRLEIVRTLNSAYAALPPAHAELARAVEAPGASLAAVRALHDEGRRLLRLAKELSKGEGDSDGEN